MKTNENTVSPFNTVRSIVVHWTESSEQGEGENRIMHWTDFCRMLNAIAHEWRTERPGTYCKVKWSAITEKSGSTPDFPTFRTDVVSSHTAFAGADQAIEQLKAAGLFTPTFP